MMAVFRPKSLYSGLEIFSLLAVVLNEANIIQDTRATNAAISIQSATFEPFGRGRYERTVRPSAAALVFCFRADQVSSATVVRKNSRFPHKRGCCVRVKSRPARYVNQELTISPTRTAAPQRWANDMNW